MLNLLLIVCYNTQRKEWESKRMKDIKITKLLSPVGQCIGISYVEFTAYVEFYCYWFAMTHREKNEKAREWKVCDLIV